MPSRSRTPAGPLIAATLIVLAIGIAIVVLAVTGATPQGIWQSFFPVQGSEPATDRGRATRDLYTIVFAIAAAIFLLVEGLIIFTGFRYRRKDGDEELPPQTHGNNLVEVIWTVIPLGIVLFLFYASWTTLNTVDASSPAGGVYVRAVAARFQWKFDYLDGPDGPNAKVVYEQLLPSGDGGGLVLPVDQAVHITLTSPDVIHAFYVPKFLFKRDVVPGKLNNFDFTIEDVGTYRGQCAELCGEFHGSMLFEVHALSQSDFDTWMANAIKSVPPSAAPASPGAPAGSPGAPAGSPGAPAGQVVQLQAKGTAFTQTSLTAPANTPFTIHFDNQDPLPHNVKISDSSGKEVFSGPLVNGPAAADYQVPALAAGSYPFVCIVHANMTGTITVQ
jgi:cytochrome c oxidase subunit 2